MADLEKNTQADNPGESQEIMLSECVSSEKGIFNQSPLTGQSGDVQQSQRAARIIESAMAQLAELGVREHPGQTWKVVIIEPCVSDNGNWYREKILRESCPVFEGAPCRIYMFDGRQKKDGSIGSFHNDHMPGWLAARDAGSVTGNTVGQYRNVRTEMIPSQRQPGRMVEAVVADLTFCHNDTRDRIWEAFMRGMMPAHGRSLYELSIEATGPHKTTLHESGRQVRMVEAINSAKEVTIVSDGAAGGRFLEPIQRVSESTRIGYDSPAQVGHFSEEKTFLKAAQAEKSVGGNSITSKSHGDRPLTEGPLATLASPYKLVKNDALPGGNFKNDEDLQSETTGAPDSPTQSDMIPQFGDDAISQVAKASDVLRTGNATLANEILVEILNKAEQEPVAPSDSPIVGNQAQQNLNQYAPKRESNKEPRKMPHENEESEGQGSVATQRGQVMQYAESLNLGYSSEDIDDFVRVMAQKDAERDLHIANLMESVGQLTQVAQAQQQTINNYEKTGRIRESQQVLRMMLRESGLPADNQAMIAEQLEGREFNPATAIKLIDRHKVNYARMQESLGFREGQGGGGYPGYQGGNPMHIQAGRSSLESIQAEFDRALGYDPTKDLSLTESDRQIYRNLPRTASIKRPIGLWHGDMEYNFDGRVGQGALLREAASTDVGLAALLQNSMTKSVMQKFMLLPAQYRDVAEIVPAANFLEHQVIVTGGLGILPQVLESKTGVSYLTLGFPSNFQTKYTVGTYGGLIPVTRQAIINDNLQEIQEYPKRAAESAMMTVNMYVFGTLIGFYGTSASGAINTALSYDGKEYYHANHFNKTTAEMSYSELIDMQNRLFEQRTFGNSTTLHSDITAGDSTFTVTSGVNDFVDGVKAGDMVQIEAEKVKILSKSSNTFTIDGTFASNHTAGPDTLLVLQLSTPIAFDKRILVVPTQLAPTAFQLLGSVLHPEITGNAVNALYPAYAEGALKVLQLHSMFLKDKLKNYYMTAGKPIRWAFLGGRETPEVMLQDNPLVGNVFTGDLISWKCRHEHGGVLMSHLMVQAGLVGS